MSDRDAKTTDERKRPRERDAPAKLAHDRYRLGAPIGRGGMGEVVAAEDEQIGREVAIKRIAGEPTDRRIERFLREARIQGRLEHPAIPPVHELGRDSDGLPFFAMKKLAGKTMREILETRAPGEMRQRLLRCYADVCLAVEFAHVHGVLHRDIKPDNIILGDFGEVYLIDWGIAKVIGETDDFEDLVRDGASTRTGTAIGTPGYMAPEQWAGAADVDARADVYALGCTLREILEGDPEAPPELAALVARATTDDRVARAQTARELADAVQRYLDGDRDLEARRRLAREHQARADAAFAAGDDDTNRSTAMREAGRALALDPALAPAATLIGRLVLEPPRTVPPEVRASMHAEAMGRLRQLGIASMVGAFGYLLAIPGIVSLHSWAYAAFAAVVYASVFGVAALVVRRHALPTIVIVLAHAIATVLLARMFSPLWIAPCVSTVIAMAVARYPLMRGVGSSLMVWSILLAALFVPLAGEELGLLSSTYSITPRGEVLMRGLSLAPDAPPPLALTVLWIIAILTVAVAFMHVNRVADEKQRLAFHLQAWQVRQLVPA